MQLACGLPLFLRPVRAHNAKHRVMYGFSLKIGKQGWRGHIKVRWEKRHHRIALETLLENRCGISRLKLDNSNRFAATPARELCPACGTKIAHPAYFTEGCHQKAGTIPFHQCDRGGRDLPTLAPSHGEQGQGTERHTSTQQRSENGGPDPHAPGHVKRFCHMLLLLFDVAPISLYHPLCLGHDDRGRVNRLLSLFCERMVVPVISFLETRWPLARFAPPGLGASCFHTSWSQASVASSPP